MRMAHLIQTAKSVKAFREKAINRSERKILISRISGSEQEVDSEGLVNCNGFGRVRDFCMNTPAGWPVDPLPIAPACKALGIKPIPREMRSQIFQNAVCSWRCWYCYVPHDLLSGNRRNSEWFTAAELVRLYVSEQNRPLILILSGGSPDLVPEWTCWMMEELRKAGLADSCYLWANDDLSTAYVFEKLTSAEIDCLAHYRNYGRVCCFKGYDARSFSFNTRAPKEDYDRQFEIMRRLIGLGLDLYGYVTFTSPHTDGIETGVREFVRRLQGLDPNLPLRTVPLEIRVGYRPVKNRGISSEHEQSLKVQKEAVSVWNDEIMRCYSEVLRDTCIADIPLKSRELQI